MSPIQQGQKAKWEFLLSIEHSQPSFLCIVCGCNYNCQCNTNQKVFVHGNTSHKNALIVISRSIPDLFQILFDKNDLILFKGLLSYILLLKNNNPTTRIVE